MSTNLQDLLREALLNNTYDYDVLHETLGTAWKNSFSYLYNLQKSYIEYEEFFYFSNDEESRNSEYIGHLYLDEHINANFDVDYDLIHVMTREEFRTSEFYQNRFNIYDMICNPDIFFKIPIVIIDDKVIWDYTIKINKDTTNFVLPFKRSFVIKDERNSTNDEIIYIDHKIQVLVVDNKFYTRLKLNRHNIDYNEKSGVIKFNTSSFSNFASEDITNKTTEEYLNKFNVKNLYNLTERQKFEYQQELNRRIASSTDVPDTAGIMMMSIHFPNEAGRGYELGSSLIPLEFDGNDYIGVLRGELLEKFNSQRSDIYISLVYVNRLYKHRFYDDKTYTTATEDKANLLVVQEDEMIPFKTPIPVEDFMVFKRDNENSDMILQKNTEVLKMHYPNIYEIVDENINNGNIYDIYYFYYDADDLKYTVLFDYYFKFLLVKFPDRKIEEILNDIYYGRADLSSYTQDQLDSFETLFNEVMDYQYHVYKYGETDFIYRYQAIPGNENNKPVEYKIDTLKEWIRDNQWLLRDYVKEQKKLGATYHLFANTLDLESRIRKDTSNELDYTYTFDEDCYVFAFSNDRIGELLDCRVFVDGLLIGDVYHDNKLFLDYFYVPCNMVQSYSYIELEIFPQYQFKKSIEFTSMDEEKTIFLTEPEEAIYPTVADVYFKDDEEARYSHGVCNITEIYKEGEFLVETTEKAKPVRYTRLHTFKISPSIEDVLNKELELCINKKPSMLRFVVDRYSCPYIEIDTRDFNYDLHYLRIFINGRLMSRNKYRVFTNTIKSRILFLDWCNAGDLIYIDITPYRYEEIYYKEELTPEDTLLDLRNIITKPFDIRYYDVYINGRRMSLNNVFSITPWEITFVNLKSNYNLIIYEKERDWEYFGLDYNTTDYFLTFDNLLSRGIVSEEEKNTIIKNMIDDLKDSKLIINPNTNDEEKMDYEYNEKDYIYKIFSIFYIDELLPKTFYDPDVYQVTEEIMKDTFFEIYNNYITDPSKETDDPVIKERRKNYHDTLLLDPDTIIEGGGDTNSIIVYEIGHSDEVSDDLLSQTIELPKEGNIK